MTKKLLVGSVLLCIHFSSFSQNFLLFQKNKHRQAYYRVGDLISVRVKGDKEKISSKIEAITDSSLVLPGIELLVAEITDLYVDEKTRQWFIFRYKYDGLATFDWRRILGTFGNKPKSTHEEKTSI